MTKDPSWPELLEASQPKQHILQLYLCRDEAFFGRAVALFAASGLKKQEGVILVSTKAHWSTLSPLLESHGIDVPAAQARGQLSIVDAEDTLPRFMVNGMPDAPGFKRIAGEVIGRVRRSGYAKIRWWGEMVNLLWEAGNIQGFIRLEELFDEVGQEHALAIFCSVVMDPFDIEAHDVGLPGALKTHSHLIPVEHARRLEESMNRAMVDVLGAEKAAGLTVLIGKSQNPYAHVPAPQAAILWLKRLADGYAAAILAQARRYYYEPAS
ncbi:MAG: hypothetical protein EHM91_14875 [Planctomycetota bacterium]|nr:MAG: hypothetical protein EHM91_14875 [Planctomycetota bacterium]